MSKIIPVILSGGFGTRLWPLSREMTPKQFNESIINPSLFKKTAELVNHQLFEKPIIVSNINHKFLISDAISNNFETLILEPSSKNTAPAIASVMFYVKSKHGNDANILVLPSDHLISNQNLFIESVQNALQICKKNLVTFGVKPIKPETGYGYIEAGDELQTNVFAVKMFKEKPNKKTAEMFIKQGNFFWNAGIFLFNVGVLFGEYQNLAPKMLEYVEKSLKNSSKNGNTIQLGNEFNLAESNSIDYAILEKTNKICLSQMLSPWCDVGSFESLYHETQKDENQNVIRGNVQAMQTSGCFIQNNTNHLLTTYGMKESIIIQTQDATMIMPMQESQNVKKLVENLKDASKKVESVKTQRPWGTYEILDEGNGFKIKRIVVNAGKSLSLQSHEHRSENWVVIKGTATVVRNDETITLLIGQSVFIPAKAKHRLQNLTNSDVEIIEVQTGNYLGEDDIVRYQDDWGRG